MPPLDPLTVALVLLAAAAIYLVRARKRHSAPLPPGPSALPLIGNLWHVPLRHPWLAFTDWANTYGDVVHLHGLGLSIVLLNSVPAVTELLDRRATVYSHRPVFPMVGQMMALDSSMPLMDYGPAWRFHRKLVRAALAPEAVRKYRPLQEQLAVLMAQLFLVRPAEFDDHIRLCAFPSSHCAVGTSADATADDEETMDMISRSTVPGAYLVDFFPQMKRLPRWLPFTGFFAKGDAGRAMIARLVTKPFLAVKAQMASPLPLSFCAPAAGSAVPSVTRDLLEDAARDGRAQDDFETQVKWAAGALYGAGGETTYTTVLVFVALMALHPAQQARVHAELDRVVGADRLPALADRGRLPYLEAAINEAMRWHPALYVPFPSPLPLLWWGNADGLFGGRPLSIARRTAADDVYDGKFIPAGTLVLPNVWALSRDAHGAPSDAFAPERFLDAAGTGAGATDPSSYAFGFGRRICPGKYLAENSVFIMIATLLACFDFAPPADRPLELRFATGLVRYFALIPSKFSAMGADVVGGGSYPQPYECRITPRSEARAKLLEHAAALCEV
ncbi:hypothetical protein HWV62_19237 [Athelia sp. TMB]|nr:hypothetical protein HWV62_19237 [Athelia sp. TMB]